MKITKTLDASSLSCPLLVIQTKRAMDELEKDDILQVIVADKGALNDLSAWLRAVNYSLVSQKEAAGHTYFYIQKAPQKSS